MASGPLRPTTLEIDLDAAAGNLRAVRGLVGPGRKIFAVLKADGYGYGAAEMGAVFARKATIRASALLYPTLPPARAAAGTATAEERGRP